MFSDLFEDDPQRLKAVDRILAPVARRLSSGSKEPFRESVEEPDAPGVEFRMIFNHVRRARTNLPARSVLINEPTLTGYAPEGMFSRLLRRRIVPKLRMNQCGNSVLNPKSCRILFVANHMLGYQHVFDSPWYRREFVAAIREVLPRESQRIDAVAIGCPEPFTVAILACLTANSDEIARYIGANEQSTILRMA